MRNFGLIIEEKKRDTDFQLGAVEKIALRQDGQWTDYMPECEIQKSDLADYMDCVTESAINSLDLIIQQKFNNDTNWSQRFTAKMSGTTANGNTQYKVADSLRHHGAVKETDWPRNRGMSWNQYYASIPQAIKNLGLKFLTQFEVNYEYVPVNKDALKEALKYGPVQVTGYAWAEDNGIYKDYGYRPNHAFLLVGYEDNKHWIVYDSYPTDFIIDENSAKQEFIKKLAWNFKFGDAMLYSLKLKATDNRTWLYKIFMALKNLKWNFWVNKSDPSKGYANGEIYIVKNGKKKKVDDINDVMAVLEMNFGIEKTDWGELGQYQTVDKF